MFWVSKVFAPLALIAGMAATTAAVTAEGEENQPPEKGEFGKGGFGKGGFGKWGEKKGEKDDKAPPGEKKGPPDKPGPAQTPPKADPQVEAWLAVLLTKITDPHDTVRDSARGAVVAVGREALPALQKLADGDDTAKAVAARKLIAAIHGHGHPAAPGMPFGGMGHPGMPGGGPWGSGGFGPPGNGPTGPGGPKRGGRGEEEDVELAPMPRELASR
jgi:hypothetical protein